MHGIVLNGGTGEDGIGEGDTDEDGLKLSILHCNLELKIKLFTKLYGMKRILNQ